MGYEFKASQSFIVIFFQVIQGYIVSCFLKKQKGSFEKSLCLLQREKSSLCKREIEGQPADGNEVVVVAEGAGLISTSAGTEYPIKAT